MDLFCKDAVTIDKMSPMVLVVPHSGSIVVLAIGKKPILEITMSKTKSCKSRSVRWAYGEHAPASP